MFKLKSNNSLKSFGLIFILIICIVFAGWFYMFKVSNALYEETTEHLHEIAKQSTIILDNKIRGDIQSLTSLASYIALQDDPFSKEVKQHINNEITEEDQNRIFISDTKGNAESNDGVKINISNRDYFKVALSGDQHVSNALNSLDDNKPIICLSVPIIKDNKIIGTLTNAYPIEKYMQLISVTSFDNHGYSYVIDYKGDVVIHSTHPKSNKTFTNIFEVLDNKNNSKEIDQLKTNLGNNANGVQTFNIKDEEFYYAYVPLNNQNRWYVFTTVPSSYIFDKANTVIKTGLVSVLFMLLLFIAIFYYVVRSFNKNGKQIENLAYRDPLTGAPNLSKFEIDATRLLEKDRNYALIEFDIDNFKYMNEMFGYQEGNVMLKHIVNSLTRSINKGELLCRSNADYFLLLLKYDTDFELSRRLQLFTRVICNYTNKTIDHYELTLTWGIYKVHSGYAPLHIMIDRASMARKSNKNLHRSTFTYYDDSIKSRIIEDKDLETNMLSALNNGDFIINLQPKHDINTSNIIGCESLIRWKHNKVLIAPDRFIPLFEKNGFIAKIDMYAIKEACKLLQQWKNEELPLIPIGINLSRVTLSKAMFILLLMRIVESYDIDPKYIEFEINENYIFNDFDHIIILLHDLEQKGFPIAIDNFGVGCSSLNLLKDVPLNSVKLDRSFITNTYNSKRGEILITNTVEMAHRLDIKVVAEGIETVQQLEFVKKIHCDSVQGYYFSPIVDTLTFNQLYIKTNDL
ncbi:MAG: EAL domain-containing protein [Erysipelotrichaceae bacterium]